jgi:hypothetical protein
VGFVNPLTVKEIAGPLFVQVPVALNVGDGAALAGSAGNTTDRTRTATAATAATVNRNAFTRAELIAVSLPPPVLTIRLD